MSERELRKILGPLEWIPSEISGDLLCPGCDNFDFEGHAADCKLASALAAEPDVVKVLRWLADGDSKITDDTYAAKQWHAVARAVSAYLRTQFHVRLTDDGKGWEWTE